MKFEVNKASDCLDVPPKEVELNTIDELMTFMKGVEHDLIISPPGYKAKHPRITIYDTWVE